MSNTSQKTSGTRTKRLEHLNQLLSQHPNLGQGVRDTASGIAAYDTASALQYVRLAIVAANKPVEQKRKGLAIGMIAR